MVRFCPRQPARKLRFEASKVGRPALQTRGGAVPTRSQEPDGRHCSPRERSVILIETVPRILQQTELQGVREDGLLNPLHRLHEQSRRNKLMRLLEEFRPTSETRVLEVGVANTEPLPATNYLIKHYPFRHNLTALGLGDMSGFSRLHPDVPVFSYSGQHFPFPQQSFDLVHSNAVIEHVGDRNAQREFLSELRRVAKSGMVTTPNKQFPIETHTLLPLVHWSDESTFRRIVEHLGVARLERLHNLLGRAFPTDELSTLRLLSAEDLARLAQEVGLPRFEIKTQRLLGFPFMLVLTWRVA